MKILVINSGSSSIKYQLIDMPSAEVLSNGLVERIGLKTGNITHKFFKNGQESKHTESFEIPDHKVGLRRVAELLTDAQIGVISNPDEIGAVGHRIVHGGECFADTCIATNEVKKGIEKLFNLAPLHNPANLEGITVAEQIFPKAKQITVFDTAFHQTMPPVAFRYAIPENLYSENAIRKYGFHGTSHKYVSQKALEYLGNPKAKIITIHLGNGCSMSAIKDGKCIDTSMGLGPMNGLIMGTRCGDIDPSIVFYMVNELGYTLDQVNHILNKESGIKGLTGFTDMRDVEDAVDKCDPVAIFATEIYAYHIKQFIGAYTAALNGLDAIVFTAGVGENDFGVRSYSCRNMDFFGLKIDEEKNKKREKGIRELQTTDSKAKILVVPTNEELEIAAQTYQLVK